MCGIYAPFFIQCATLCLLTSKIALGSSDTLLGTTCLISRAAGKLKQISFFSADLQRTINWSSTFSGTYVLYLVNILCGSAIPLYSKTNLSEDSDGYNFLPLPLIQQKAHSISAIMFKKYISTFMPTCE